MRVGTAEGLGERELKALWQKVFGDSEDYIDSFFKTAYRPENTLVCRLEGRLAGAVYLLPGFSYVRKGERRDCLYFYALGTLPEFRGRGVAAALTEGAIDFASERLCCLYPASESLYTWYVERFGARPAFSLLERRFSHVGEDLSGLCLKPLNALEYGALREKLLEDRPHVAFPESLLDWQRGLCVREGGGLLALQSSEGELLGCAAVLSVDGQGFAPEVLLKPSVGAERAAEALCGALGCSEIALRLPSERGGASGLRLLALPTAAYGLEALEAELPYWGPVFD